MIDKGLYKTGRVGLRGGADAATASFAKSYDKAVGNAPGTTKGRTESFNPGTGGGGPTFGNAVATQTSGDDVRRAKQKFIKNVQKTNPRYTGGPTRNLPTVGEFFGGILNASPIVNFLRNLSRGIRNTDFGRSTSLMDYLDMRKYGGYDEREMARRINLDEAKLLQDRIDAGEFDGIGSLGTDNNIIDNIISNIDKLSNQPNLQELYNTDRNISLNQEMAKSFTPDEINRMMNPPGQMDNTGINFYNDDAVPLDPNLNIFKVNDLRAELTDKQKRFIDSKKFPLQENLVSPQSVFDTITNPDLGIYDTGTFGFGAQEPTTEEEYNDYLRSLGLTQTI